jgi:phage gp46-like protein
MAKLVIGGWQDGGVIAVDGWASSVPGGGFEDLPLVPCILDISEGDGILMATAISLFCDRRILFTEDPPLTKDDRRGWWGDNSLVQNDHIGSKLWTLGQMKMVDEKIFPEALSFCRDALQWMIDDGFAKNVDIKLTKLDQYSIGFEIIIARPDEKDLTRYYFTWLIYAKTQGV